MKIFLLIFGLLGCVYFGFSQSDTINQVDKKGKKQGTWSKKYPNGKTRYTGQFENDKPIGTFFYFDQYGTLIGEVTHTKKDSADVIFYHDGKAIMSEGKYYRQQRTGIWKFYDGEGDITSQCIFVEGKKHGPERIYFKDGRVAKELHYQMGTLHGPVIEYFPTGKVKFKGEYKDGNLDGQVEHFHPNGARKVLGYYQFAVRNNTWTTYDYDGKPKTIQYYKEGRLIWTKTPEQIRKEKEEKVLQETDSTQTIDNK